MSAGNTEFIRNAMSKELIFTMGFSVVASFISDFLQPLANITFYVLILSAVLSAIFLLLYLVKKDIRKKFTKYLIASITIMALSGFLYTAQDESNSEKGVLAANFPALGNLQKDLGMLEKDIAEIKESTLRTEQLVESIAEDSKENIKQTKELTETIKDSNEAIVNKLDEINDSFQEISKLGGIISDPKRPEEFYTNARVYEDRGDYLNARRMYNQYFTFKLDYIDPHIRYQTFLKVQEGRAGAREVYNSLFSNDNRITIEYLKILLYNAPTRTQLLKEFIQKNKDFAPAYYELSKDFSPSRTGQESLSNRKLELENLEKFMELNNEGKFIRYFLDKSIAAEWVKYSEERISVLNSGLNEIKETYFNDGSISLRTNYRNGIREGEELEYASKNDSLRVYDGIIVDHYSRGREILVKVKDLNWYDGNNILIRKNFYEGGELKKSEDLKYYSSGEIFNSETFIPASKTVIDNLKSQLWSVESMLKIEKDRELDNKINKCDDWDNRGSMECMGSGFGANDFSIQRYEEDIKRLKQEISNAREKTGQYKFFYKNGQIEDEGINENGEKKSFAFFSQDGVLEIKGNIKNYFSPFRDEADFRYLHGSYEKYHNNGQLMIKGVFEEGELIAPYKVFYENGDVFLEKNDQGMYKKFSPSGVLLLEVQPIKCEKEIKYNRASNSKGMEVGIYKCYKLTYYNEENNGEFFEKEISIQPFQSNASGKRGNCLKPTYVCEGTSPNFLNNFYD